MAFCKAAAALVAETNPADVAALSSLPYSQDGFGPTLEDVRKGLIGKIGENMSIRRFVRIDAKGKLTSYVHGGSKIGVLIDVVGGDEQMAKDLAMHIAASKPKALDSSGVPADLLDTERRIAVEKAREAGRKGEIARKICHELIVHSMIEEEIFYPAIRGKVEDDLLDESYVEHDGAKMLIAEILNGREIRAPLVIHGGTGLSDEVTRRLVELGGSKFNVSTELKHVLMDATAGYLAGHLKDYNPGKLDAAVFAATLEAIRRWMDILGSAGQY